MQLKTESGILDTATLPKTYEPCFCAKCGNRLGWKHEDTVALIVLCDGCSATVSQDADEDPMRS